MSKTFFDGGRGIVYKVIDGNYNQLAFNSTFTTQLKGSTKDGCEVSTFIIQNVSMKKGNITIPVVGVDKKRLLYTFGEDFGQLIIDGIILTGGSKYDGKQPKELLKRWDESSLASNNEPCSTNWAGNDMKIAISNMDITVENTELGILGVSIAAYIIPVTNKHS